MQLQGLIKHDNFGHKIAMEFDLGESNANKRRYGCINYRNRSELTASRHLLLNNLLEDAFFKYCIKGTNMKPNHTNILQFRRRVHMTQHEDCKHIPE